MCLIFIIVNNDINFFGFNYLENMGEQEFFFLSLFLSIFRIEIEVDRMD
jgi:hypothetical protein